MPITGTSKVKVRTCTWTHRGLAPLCESSSQKRSGMAHVLKGSHSFTCTPRLSSATEMNHFCLCLPSYIWYSFTDPGGMEGELARVAGYVVRQFTCLKAVSHPTTNRAQCRATRYCYTKPPRSCRNIVIIRQLPAKTD